MQRLITKGNLPRRAAQRARAKSRQRLLRKRRATPRAHRATFADDGVAADVVERSGAERAPIEATGQNAARLEANLVTRTAAKSALKLVAKSATNLATNLGVNLETTASAAATVRDAAGQSRDSSGPRRRPLVPVATTITGRHRDINRWCYPANRSRNTSGRRRVRGRPNARPWRRTWPRWSGRCRRRSYRPFLKMSRFSRPSLPSLFTNNMST